jgi:hypothetical protein
MILYPMDAVYTVDGKKRNLGTSLTEEDNLARISEPKACEKCGLVSSA